MKGTGNLQLQQQYRTTNRGFTLIEVLIAIFISSIVLSILYASYFQTIKVKDHVEKELELYHEVRIIFAKMTKDLATAFPRGEVNAKSSNILLPYFLGSINGEFSTLSFTSLSHNPTKDSNESDQSEISYFVESIPDSDTELYALIRRDNPWIGSVEGGIQYPISERVTGFTLSYINSLSVLTGSEDLIYDWDSRETSSLPKAVYVNLVIRSPRGEDVEFNSLILIPVMN